ncbi:MAG: hypothetical protein WC839_03090 [Candidatus Paceibacterota bacterium]
MDENIDLNKNTEISEALKEFEIKSSIEQIQKNPEISKNIETPKMVQWVIKYSGGIIKEQKQAEYVLLGIAVLAIVLTIILILNILKGSSVPPAEFRKNTPDNFKIY